jgi:heme exporter protein B
VSNTHVTSIAGAALSAQDEAAAAPVSSFRAAGLALRRDLTLAFRKPAQLIQPLTFFALVTMLFPLAISPELSQLRQVAPGALWAAALLASLLALEFLFRDDSQDGTLEQYALSGCSLTALIFAKTLAHWLLTGLPLALMAPFAAVALGAPTVALPGIIAAVVLGSVTLSLIGSIGAALTLNIKRSGTLVAPLELLAALAVLGVTLAPLAAAAAVRISLE